MNLSENIKLAIRAIRSNLLRTSITVMIILLGIAALICILTATEGIRKTTVSSLSEMGSNTFFVTNEGGLHRRGGSRRHRKEVRPALTLQQTREFKKNYNYPALIAVSNSPTDIGVVVFSSKKTNPNVRVMAMDENYLKVSGNSVLEGRNFSSAEIENGSDVILLGKDVVAKIFEPYDTVIGKMVTIGSRKYKVTGVLTSKGASQNSSDNVVMIPLENARFSFPQDNTSYTMNIMVADASELDRAMDEATGVLRGIRKLRLNDENDFNMEKSERLADQALSIVDQIGTATAIIGVLTLLSAGIALMNIMLVSVNERTREIGVSKAIGANRRTIIVQFLTESVVICQIGGVLGIIIGVLLGNLIGIFLKTGFIFPLNWVAAGISFTFLVGLAAGIYPAIKASRLDPVEALRYE